MKFTDKINFSAKIVDIAKKQNKTLKAFIDTGEGHDLLPLVPIFIGTFFQYIQDDDENKEIFHLLANTSEEKIESVERILSLYFFYILDRIYGYPLLNDENKVLLPLRAIWGWSHNGLPATIKQFDDKPMEEVLFSYPVELMAKFVGPEFNSFSVVNHLDHSMKSVLRK